MHSPIERGAHLCRCRGWDLPAHQAGGRLDQLTRRAAIRGAPDDATRRIDTRCVDSCEVERARIGKAVMNRDFVQIHRTIGKRVIEDLAIGFPPWELACGEWTGDQPIARS